MFVRVVRVATQDFMIEPPHITVRHHFQHFAWLKPQAVPSNPAFYLLLSQVKLVWEAFPEAFCLHDQIIWDLSIRRSSGSIFRDFWISELRTLLKNVTPSILRKNLISEACTCDRILSVLTQDHRWGWDKNCSKNWELCFFSTILVT